MFELVSREGWHRCLIHSCNLDNYVIRMDYQMALGDLLCPLVSVSWVLGFSGKGSRDPGFRMRGWCRQFQAWLLMFSNSWWLTATRLSVSCHRLGQLGQDVVLSGRREMGDLQSRGRIVWWDCLNRGGCHWGIRSAWWCDSHLIFRLTWSLISNLYRMRMKRQWCARRYSWSNFTRLS